MRRTDGNHLVGVARIGDADGAIAVADALLFGSAFESGVAGGGHHNRPGADQMVAGLADRRLSASEAVDVVRQRQRKLAPCTTGLARSLFSQPTNSRAQRIANSSPRPFGVEHSKIVDRQMWAYAHQRTIGLIVKGRFAARIPATCVP